MSSLGKEFQFLDLRTTRECYMSFGTVFLSIQVAVILLDQIYCIGPAQNIEGWALNRSIFM